MKHQKAEAESPYGILFTDIKANYFITVALILVGIAFQWFLLSIGLNRADIILTYTEEKLWIVMFTIVSILFVIVTSKFELEEMHIIKLKFVGIEVPIWIKGSDGIRFIWFWKLGLFSFLEHEIHKIDEKIDVVVDPFTTPDKKNRLIEVPVINLEAKIVDSEKYKTVDASVIKRNLTDAAKEVLIRVIASKDYDTELKGENVGKMAIKDRIFEEKHKHDGLEITNFIAPILPKNREQDDINRMYKDLLLMVKDGSKDITDKEAAERALALLGKANMHIIPGDARLIVDADDGRKR